MKVTSIIEQQLPKDGDIIPSSLAFPTPSMVLEGIYFLP